MVDSYLAGVPEEEGLRKEAETLLAEEMLRMVTRDAAMYPFKGSMIAEEVADSEMFDDKELDNASQLLKKEIASIKKKLRHGELSSDAVRSSWEEGNKNMVFDDDVQLFVDGKNVGREERLNQVTSEFQIKKDVLDQEAKKIESLQKKVNVLLGGYPKRGKQIQHTIAKNLQDLDQYLIEQEVFKQLQSQEQRAVYSRVEELRRFYEDLSRKEADLQKKHEKLLREKEEVLKEPPVIRFF